MSVGLALLGLFLGLGIALCGWFLSCRPTVDVEGAADVIADAIRYYAECRAGHHRPEPEEDEGAGQLDPDHEAFVEWVLANIEPGSMSDDYLGMYEIVTGKRPARASRIEQCRERLLRAGAPLPGLQRSPLP